MPTGAHDRQASGGDRGLLRSGAILQRQDSCAEDGGRPSEIGFQERVSNQSKRPRPKAVVVSVRETIESKPTDDALLRNKRHQNQRREAPLG
jgi:hypothetical protein